MNISVTDPLVWAFRRTRWILFEPFDLGKWFVLGFCAWLAYLGQGFGPGFSGGGNGGGGGHGGGSGFQDFHHDVVDPVMAWVMAHLPLLILGAVAVLLVGVAVGALLTWLRSRGKFMFLDGVAQNQARVVEPWHRFRAQGNSLFWFKFLLGLITLAAMLLAVGGGAVLAWPDVLAWELGWRAITALVLNSCLFLVMAPVMTVIQWLTEDFVIPAMYIRGVGVIEAWRIVWREILAVHLGPVVLFALMRIVVFMGMAVVVGTFMLAAMCMTCCLACCVFWAPFVGTIPFLPVRVFVRSFTLYFIQQFGESWQAIAAEPSSGPPMPEVEPAGF